MHPLPLFLSRSCVTARPIPSSGKYLPCNTDNSARHMDDFIRKLPYEVITLIFRHLHTIDIVECMYVSISWRDYLSGWPDPWRDVTIMSTCQANAIQVWIPNIHRHVHELALSCTDTLFFYKTMGFIGAGYFQQLRSLQIYKCNATDLLPVVDALKCIGGNLRTLLLEFMAELLPIEQVLQACPKLTELCYYTPLSRRESSLSSSSSIAIPTNTNLEHLQLHVSNLRRQHLEHVLRAFPNVRYLSIQTCDVDGLAVINQYCRHLEFLCYNTGPYLVPWMRLLGREDATTIGLSRDHRSSGRFGLKTAEVLASEFLDVFPEGIPKWVPTHTCGIDHLRGFRRGYDQNSHPKILAAVFQDDDIPNIVNISSRFLSRFLGYGAIPDDVVVY